MKTKTKRCVCGAVTLEEAFKHGHTCKRPQFPAIGMWICVGVFFLFFALVFLHGQSVPIRPKLHMALTDPGHNGAILLEMWCDQITVGHDDSATYCWHNGVAVIKVPHNAPFSWAPLEAK